MQATGSDLNTDCPIDYARGGWRPGWVISGIAHAKDPASNHLPAVRQRIPDPARQCSVKSFSSLFPNSCICLPRPRHANHPDRASPTCRTRPSARCPVVALRPTEKCLLSWTRTTLPTCSCTPCRLRTTSRRHTAAWKLVIEPSPARPPSTFLARWTRSHRQPTSAALFDYTNCFLGTKYHPGQLDGYFEDTPGHNKNPSGSKGCHGTCQTAPALLPHPRAKIAIPQHHLHHQEMAVQNENIFEGATASRFHDISQRPIHSWIF